MDEATSYSRDESSGARLDRNFNEQLQELRIAQAGVQILFAFLLTIPFQQRFSALNDVQIDVYVVTLIASAVSVVMFTAPVAMHRILFREGVKDFIVRFTSRMMSVGLGTLALAIIGGTTLVLDVLLSRGAALWLGASLTVLIVLLWALVPAWRRAQTDPGKG